VAVQSRVMEQRTVPPPAARQALPPAALSRLRSLPAALTSRIETIAAVSRESGVPAFLVGGFVRDLLLARDDRDLDVVVEGDGIAFAHRFAAAVGGRVKVHGVFLTATVVDPQGFPIDVATARREVYRTPAALPEVEAATIEEDLYRRDVTINTLALRLGPEPGYELVDPFGGVCDLEAGTLRVLHADSFRDDPTRILRAVRLEQRLGFRIVPETLGLIAEALAAGAFDHLSGSRLKAELAKLLGDPVALQGIERLAELGVLRAIDPRLAIDDGTVERLRGARKALEEYRHAEPSLVIWRLFLTALVAGWEESDLARLADRLLLAGEERRLLTGFPRRLAAARAVLSGDPAPHRVAEALDSLSGEEILLLMAEGDEAVRAWVRRYLEEMRPLTLAVQGADLVAAGIPPGPRIGEALRATREARLDGRIAAADELSYALAFLGGKRE
jgi:tRNA nucleotidyltransferase (CCA-adding enzyme)